MIIEGTILRLGEILPNGDMISKDCEIIIPDNFKIKTNKMKKQLPKIAIKYSEENWPEIKKAVDYLRSKGFNVEKRKDAAFKHRNLHKYYLRMCEIDNLFHYDIFLTTKKEDFTILTMPADFEKLKSYFEEEPKRGEVIVFENGHNGSDLAIIRVEKFNEKECDYISRFRNTFGIKKSYMTLGIKHRKATPEEEAKLIKAEHDNGYHWDGNELFKIPEYVECVKTSGTGFTVGKTYNFPNPKDDDGDFRWIKIMDGSLFQFKSSTKEAYEAQQKPKFEVGKWYKSKFDELIRLYIGNRKGVGFDNYGKWSNTNGMTNPSLWQPADTSKVKELLIKEAEKKYPHKTRFDNANKDATVCSSNSGISTGKFKINDVGVFTNNQYVFWFKSGKWAEIIEEKEQHGESPVSRLIKDGFDVNKPFFGLKSSDNFFNEIKYFSNELLSTIGNINGHNGIPNCRCCLIPEQHKTPSEAINSPKRLTKQVEKLEKRVIDLKEENERLKSEVKNIKAELSDHIDKVTLENKKIVSGYF